MPRYNWNVNDTLFEEDVRKMYDKAARPETKALISILWLTGARPEELIRLKKENFVIGSEKVDITIKTMKLGKETEGDFKVRERILTFKRTLGFDTNIYLETLLNYVMAIQQPDGRLFDYSTRWVLLQITNISKEVLGKQVTPYHFRHSVMTWLAKNGAMPAELMHFKGAASLNSVTPYITAIPYMVNLENMRRSRAVSGQELTKTEPDFLSETKQEEKKEEKKEGS